MVKKLIFVACVLMVCLTLVKYERDKPRSMPQITSPVQPFASRLTTTLRQTPLYFVENQGQLDEQVAYYVQGRDTTLYFTPQGVTFALLDNTRTESSAPRSADEPKHFANPETTTNPQRWAVKLDFVDANPDAEPVGVDQTPAVVSYFKGTPEDWQTDLPTYSRVVYADVWPGIDLVYSGTASQLKYEFVVRPGADPNQIQLRYRGATSVASNDAGQLEVKTPVGGFVDDAPYAYQTVGRDEVEVKVVFDLDKETQTYGFVLGRYDASRVLVIDPVVLIYAGYIGGSGLDAGADIAVDTSGNAYITGWTSSDEVTFPQTVGPDTTFNGGYDAYVVKVNMAGTSLAYAGYIGGNSDEYGEGIAVDDAGNAYVTGHTGSDQTTFPVIGGPDLIYNGNDDAFVAKVNAAGTALTYAGYIGGSNGDIGLDIALDAAGNSYITGYTYSSEATFPVVVGPDLTYNGGTYDTFVAKVNVAGTALVYSGYIGGSGNEPGNNIAVDNAGNAYVTGNTNSSEATFPVSVGPDLTFNGVDDVFVAKVNIPGTALAYAGYIGGSEDDRGNSIAVDETGNAYVVGYTYSDQTTFPDNIGPDLIYNGGGDVFVAKVNAAGGALLYAGYIGGSSEENGYGLAIDNAGNAYVSGYTTSDQTTFPVLGGPDLIHNGLSDAFITKVNAGGETLIYSGYIGGSGSDSGTDIAVDMAGNAYVVGGTNSTEATFPETIGPDLTYNGADDAFVAKVADTTTADLAISKADTPDPVVVNQNLTYTLVISNNVLSAATATTVTLTDTLPTSVSFVSANPSQGSCSGTSTVTCNLGSISSGAMATVTVVVQPTLEGVITNTVSVAGDQSDPTLSNNTATQTTIVIPESVWTFMVYLNGDNNLDPWTFELFNRLEMAVANNQSLNIHVLWDRLGESNTIRYRVLPDSHQFSLANYEPNVNMWDEGEKDMGDPATLAEFINTVRNAYPDTKTFLSLVNHGGGWSPDLPEGQAQGRWVTGASGFSWDETNDYHYLSTKDMGNVLSEMAAVHGMFDVVFYDACLMSMVEEAYEIRASTQYMIASENLTWTSFPYEAYFSNLSIQTTPSELATMIVDEYHDSLGEFYPHTLSVLDMSRADIVANAVDNLAGALIEKMPASQEEIYQAYLASQKLDYDFNLVLENELEGYVDLASFATALLQEFSGDNIAIAAQEVLSVTVDSTTPFIIYEQHQSATAWITNEYIDLEEIRGISIYLPLGEPDDADRAYYTDLQLDWAQDTRWDNFLLVMLGTQPPGDGTSRGMPPNPGFLPYFAYLPLVTR